MDFSADSFASPLEIERRLMEIVIADMGMVRMLKGLGIQGDGWLRFMLELRAEPYRN